MRTLNAWSLKENYIYAPWTHRAPLTRWLWLECCARWLTRNWTCCNGPNDQTTTADIGLICWPWHQMSRTWRRYGATDWKTSTRRGDWQNYQKKLENHEQRTKTVSETTVSVRKKSDTFSCFFSVSIITSDAVQVIPMLCKKKWMRFEGHKISTPECYSTYLWRGECRGPKWNHQIEKIFTYYLQTGLHANLNHCLDYKNHPFDLMEEEQIRWRRRLESVTNKSAEEIEHEIDQNLQVVANNLIFKPMRILFETMALDSVRMQTNGAQIDFIKNKILPRTGKFWSLSNLCPEHG